MDTADPTSSVTINGEARQARENGDPLMSREDKTYKIVRKFTVEVTQESTTDEGDYNSIFSVINNLNIFNNWTFKTTEIRSISTVDIEVFETTSAEYRVKLEIRPYSFGTAVTDLFKSWIGH